MEENKETKNTQEDNKDTAVKVVQKTGVPKKEARGRFSQDKRGGRQGYRSGGRRGGRGGRTKRVKPEFDQKIVNIRRVTRVVSGGRRFSFSVAIVAGNRNGKVGVGVGKATDTSLAIEKAFKNAKKNMVEIKRNKERSINHEVGARYCTSEVYIKPAKGKGIVAGSSARNVLDLAGVTDVSSKILSRSKNKVNIARATVLALGDLSD